MCVLCVFPTGQLGEESTPVMHILCGSFPFFFFYIIYLGVCIGSLRDGSTI